MAAAPKSPVTLFFEALRTAPTLKGRVAVLFGREHLARTDKTRRIVLYQAGGMMGFPSAGPGRNTDRPPLARLDTAMVARVWADSHDDGWDIQRRLVQALKHVTAQGGALYRPGPVDDTSNEDGSLQGEALVIHFNLDLPIEPVAELEATIEEVDIDTMVGATVGPEIVIR